MMYKKNVLYRARDSPRYTESVRDLVMHSMQIGFASKTLQCIEKTNWISQQIAL